MSDLPTRELTYKVRAGRVGKEGYRGCIMLPTKHGEIILTATIPDGAVNAFRMGVRQLLREPEVGALGPYALRTLATEVGCPCIGGVVDTIQTGLSALGPWGAAASAGLGAINSLFGGGTYGGPVVRPENLPAEGSTTNLLRIARHVGITPGMAVPAAKAKLENGLRQNWAGADHNDARKLIGALNALGQMPPTLEQLANVATRVGPDGQLNLPRPPQMPMQRPQMQRPQMPAPPPPSPALAQGFVDMMGGQMEPEQLAPYLGAAATLADAYELATGPGGEQLFGQAAPDMGAWLAASMQAADNIAGVELYDAPKARDRLARASAHLDPRITEAVRAARQFHEYLHEGM